MLVQDILPKMYRFLYSNRIGHLIITQNIPAMKFHSLILFRIFLLPAFLLLASVGGFGEEILFEQNHPDSILGWEWDTLQEDWDPDFRNVYTFNQEQQIVIDHHFKWYGDGWGNSRLKTNTYDNAGNLIQE